MGAGPKDGGGSGEAAEAGVFSCRLGEDEAATQKELEAESVFMAGDCDDSSKGEIFGLATFGQYPNGLGFLVRHVCATCPRGKQEQHLTWLEHVLAR
jgi:hypothetical protein